MKLLFISGKALAAIVAVLSVSAAAFAQNAENQVILEVVNDTAPAQAQPAQTTQVVQSAPVVTVQPSQPVVLQQPQIVQQQPTIYVQKQATSVVEDTPLVESAAERLRKQRIEVEQQTESKIVEKLEEARMKAEQERATKLLSGLEEKKEEKASEEKKEEKVEEKKVEEAAVAPLVVAPQAVQVVAPVEPVIQQAPVEVKAEASALEPKKEENVNYYVTFDAGFISYDATNIETGVGVGATFGTIFDERFVVEGNFAYSRADIESPTRPAYIGQSCYYPYSCQSGVYPTIVRMDQYNLGGTIKYKILKTRFSPFVGGTLNYVYRDYQDIQYFDSNYALEASSWAIDAGLLVGADIKLSESFAIGSEFKYMFNITNQVDSGNRLQQSKLLYEDFYSNPVEEVGYYSFGVSLKYLF